MKNYGGKYKIQHPLKLSKIIGLKSYIKKDNNMIYNTKIRYYLVTS